MLFPQSPATSHQRKIPLPKTLLRWQNAPGPQVTALGFGAMGLSAFYGAPESDEERFKVLDRAYALGETFWDSADVYLDSEDLIGKWFKRTGKREDIFLATKFANSVKDGKVMVRSDPEYVKEACAKSLKRLGISTIDLYYCHRLDGQTPIEKTVEAMVELKKYVHLLTFNHKIANGIVREGKIRYLGLSEVSAASLRRARTYILQFFPPPLALKERS